jgi:tryptophan-rich sensory protein
MREASLEGGSAARFLFKGPGRKEKTMTSPRWMRPTVLALLLFAVGSALWYWGRAEEKRDVSGQGAGKRDLPGWIFIVAWALIYGCVAILFFAGSGAKGDGSFAVRAFLIAYVLLGFLWIGVGRESAGISAALIGLMLIALAAAAATLAAQSNRLARLALLAPPLLWTSLALGLVA